MESMAENLAIKICEVRREGFRIYYRVLVNSIEKPSLVFIKASDRTVYGESALEKWCAKNVDKLESGTVVEAKLSEEIAQLGS